MEKGRSGRENVNLPLIWLGWPGGGKTTALSLCEGVKGHWSLALSERGVSRPERKGEIEVIMALAQSEEQYLSP